MPQWERDLRMRKRLAWALAVAEALALAGNLVPICWGALRSFSPRLGIEFTPGTLISIAAAVAAVALVVATFEVVKYVRGAGWARLLLIVENAALIAVGIVWFLFTHSSHSDVASYAAGFGLVVPLVTLFPLLWPLISFRPVPPPAPAEQGSQ
jgi:hypothetical protein